MLTASLGYGGSESDFLRLANYLARSTDLTIALFSQDYGNSAYTTAQSSTERQTVLLDAPSRSSGGVVGKVHRWLRMCNRLVELKQDHDVTISFLSGPNVLNAVTGDPAKAIVSERGSKAHHVGIPPFRKWFYLNLLDPLVYRRVSKVVPASVGYATEIAAVAGPRLAGKIVPIEGIVSTDTLLKQTEAQADSDVERFCFGPVAVYSGRLDRGKGIDRIIPVFARVLQNIPAARLLVIGDGPLRRDVIGMCTALGLSITESGDPDAHVFLAGYRYEPMRHFRLCRLFLFPSEHEGLPNALIEGVASGIPVVAADCPWGPRSILSDPGDLPLAETINAPVRLRHGTLMPMLHTAAGAMSWHAELCEALQRAPQRRSLANRRTAIARFDIEVTGPQWLRLIDDIASDSENTARNKNSRYRDRKVPNGQVGP